jgi:RecA/RadA recombinase
MENNVKPGRLLELYGPESSGKTTLTLEMINEARRRGGIVVLIDTGHAPDLDEMGRKIAPKEPK